MPEIAERTKDDLFSMYHQQQIPQKKPSISPPQALVP